MFLLQAIQEVHSIHDPHDAFDLSFGLMQVIMICGGIISIVGLYYSQKAEVKKVEAKHDSDYRLLKQQNETITTELAALKKEFEQFDKKIGRKLDDVTTALNNITVGFADFKTDVMKYIHEQNGKP